MSFKYQRTAIQDVLVITPNIFKDVRGTFREIFKKSWFTKIGITNDFVQDNISTSKITVIRGLHYQIGKGVQGKLTQVITGCVYAVAVDLRKKSKTFGCWVAREISSENNEMMWIPPGFAHGFQSLTDNTIFQYKCTSEYDPQSERGIIWNDPTLNISWPIKDPILSNKDRTLPTLKNSEVFF